MTASRRDLAIACGLVLVTLAAYLPGFLPWPGNAFIGYDDDLYITANRYVRAGLSWEGVRWAFTTFQGANWFPLTRLSWMLDASVFGVEAWAFHATSLVIHIGGAVTLFVALSRLTGAPWPSAWVAAVFAVHPLHVESVAWASYRRDVLSGLFFALTLLAHERYARLGPTPWRYAWVCLWLALGLMTKPTLVTLPLVLLLLDVWPLGRCSRDGRFDRALAARALLEKVPMLALVAVYCVVVVLAQSDAAAVQSLQKYPLEQRLTNAIASYGAYVASAFWPVDLAVFYPHPRGGLAVWHVASLLALLVGVTAGCLRVAGRRPYLAVGWLWFVGVLVPVIGLVQVGGQARADRYTYLPLIGLSIAVAWTVVASARSRPAARTAVAIGAALSVGAMALATSQQVRNWRDTLTLFEHTLAVTGENFIAQLNLGEELIVQERFDEATPFVIEALRMGPTSAFAHAAMGEIHLAQEHYAPARHHFVVALERRPDNGVWYERLARASYGLGDTAAALAAYQQAVALEPESAGIRSNQGKALLAQGRIDEAASAYAAAVELEPSLAAARTGLGSALVERGDTRAAIPHLERALVIDPEVAIAHAYLGRALLGEGRNERAVTHLDEAVRLQPGSGTLRAFQAVALDRSGRKPRAAAAYRAAMARGVDSPEVLNNLAWLIVTTEDPAVGTPAQAVRLAERAAAATGQRNVEILDTLAECYVRAERRGDARRTLTRAASLAEEEGRGALAASFRARSTALAD